MDVKRNQAAKSGAKVSAKHPGVELSSILIFAASVFTLLSILTYNPGDPSLFSNIQGAAHNACGRVGAYLSSWILQCFGLGAFLLPAALFFTAATIHKREGSIRVIGTLGGMAVAVMAMTTFLSLQWKYWPYGGSLLLTGGAFGAWMMEILVHQFNPVGSSIVSLLVFFLAVAISTPISVAHWGAVFLKTAGIVVWKCAKLVVVYLAYLLGALVMKAAHAAGDFLQKTMESAMRKARERKEKREQEPAVEVAAEVASAFAEPEAEPELLAEKPPIEIPMLEETPPQVKAEAVVENKELEILPRKAEEKEDKQSSKIVRAAHRNKKGQWQLPTVEFLRKPPVIESAIDKDKLKSNSQILKQKFADFGIDGEVVTVRPGPVITLYEFRPAPGVKVSKIAGMVDDLQMALSAESVRILAPLPGKSVVGIEIPSETRETVYLREFLQHPDFYGQRHTIPVTMGKDIGGQTYLSDLAKMPHLLCAGQTGGGKSVFMNGLICSLLYRFTPDELRMILVDPKFIEFRSYQDIPHLLLPVVDDPKHASIALKWAVREMERRYRILAKMGARNLATFNEKVDKMGCDVVRDLLMAEENQSDTSTQLSQSFGSDWLEAFEPDENGVPRVGKLPYIVVIIDELADLMMIAKKEVEFSLARIAQKARAAGIHLICATQRPSTDVITGVIKANLPSRVSFRLTTHIDSMTILGQKGAERLLGQGDMLFIPPGVGQPVRLHGAFVDDDEITKIAAFLKAQGKPAYREEILFTEEDDDDGMDDSEADELFDEAVELVRHNGHASASFLQRHLKVGYNRAARMIETMESRGIVGPADGARPREVL